MTDYVELLNKHWFEQSFWQQQNAVIGQAKGRGTAYFFRHKDQSFVLRRYLRGGAIGKVTDDKYVYSGVKNTRAYKELALLEKLFELDLPVPKPVAALVVKQGLFYQNSIIISLIEDTKDLFERLKSEPLSSEQWIAVGATIRAFHDRGLFHADLNIHNILLDKAGKFWLIDFDKGKFMQANAPKLEQNLERLLRSLRKELAKQSNFYWQEADWAWFLQGYHSQTVEDFE